MFALDYKITIGTKRFSGVFSVEIKRNITELTGTAKIKLPATAVLKQADGTKMNVLTAQQIKRGDAVEISLGYNGKLKKEFSGYVARLNMTQPLEVECEDAVFLLRQKSIKKTFKNTTLSAVLTELTVGTGIAVSTGGLSLNIEKLILATETGGEVSRDIALSALLDRYGLVGYFDTAQRLFVGLRQGKRLETARIKLGWNTIKDDDLKYFSADEQKIQIKAIYIDAKGVKKEETAGESGGAVRTIFLTDIKSELELKKLAENELKKYKYDGYSGKLTCFLVPFAEPGSVINISDPSFNRPEGAYYCEGVEVDFGTNGARRMIEIGAKV